MKRTKLIEYALIVIAAIFGYKFFESVFGFVIQIILSTTGNSYDLAEALTPTLIISGAYLLLFILLIRQSRRIAIYLNGNKAEDTVPIKIGKKAALQLVLLAVCFTAILSVLPELIMYLYESLKSKKGFERYPEYFPSLSKEELVIKVIKLVIALIVMATSKEIANWLLKNDGKDELILEAESKDENANG
jgi:hypothetical protein